MQNDRFCTHAPRDFLHTYRENTTNRIFSITYRCTLIRRKKTTERFVFHFSATLRGFNNANIVHRNVQTKQTEMYLYNSNLGQ